MPESNRSLPRKTGYWRSLSELADSSEFRQSMEREFPGGADKTAGSLDRRRFLQVMSASFALAGLAGCKWPEEEIVPFGKRPENYDPGQTKRFATTRELGGVATGLLVTSFDGRPIKVEGNPEHPAGAGGADVFAQAAILELYDPDRSQKVQRRVGERWLDSSWTEFAGFAKTDLVRDEGRGLAVVTQEISSPSVLALLSEFRRRYPEMQLFTYDPVPAYGEHGWRDRPELSGAKVIVALDADLMVSHPDALMNIRGYGENRDPNAVMNRLYVFEPTLTATGSIADHRYPTSVDETQNILGSIAAELVFNHHLLDAADYPWLRPFLDHPLHKKAVKSITADLIAHPGAGLLVAGPRQEMAVHHLCGLLNERLGNIGQTSFPVNPAHVRSVRHLAGDHSNLSEGFESGKLDKLLILDGNPLYDMPIDMEMEAILAQASESVHIGLFANETAAACSWHLPLAHWLESWGDCQTIERELCSIQPLIAPLYDGKTIAEAISIILDDTPRSGYAMARDSFCHHLHPRETGGAPDDNTHFEAAWRQYLHSGFLKGSDSYFSYSRASGKACMIQMSPELGSGNLELVLAGDPKVFDGRYANNAWLQELPDFMTKITWDNAAVISPALADELDLSHGDLVALEHAKQTLELPVYVQPGQAHYSVSVNLGYGRTKAGRVGNGVGGNTYRLRTTKAFWGGPGLQLTPTGKKHTLACTQDHHAIDTRGAAERERRAVQLIREGTLEEYKKHPDFAAHLGVHHPPLISMWKEHKTDGHRWAMAIDLNRCVGCNACVVACQAENNIPVVGKEQVAKGREMHWLRMDRYFLGDPDDPRVAHQPVACVHCELAPCEQVCPVAATLHSEEGLNVMVYNRCVGTRYCSNNCPYKVRRFNFFNYRKDLTPVEKLAFNPDVTVRSRGIMEKCTYCVQRIETARIDARNKNTKIKDGDITPACAQTCPAEAIVFGDLSDPNSRVSQLMADSRSYSLLEELNIKPRTNYLARIRNPHLDLAAETGKPGGHGHGSDALDDHGSQTHSSEAGH